MQPSRKTSSKAPVRNGEMAMLSVALAEPTSVGAWDSGLRAAYGSRHSGDAEKSQKPSLLPEV